MIDKKQIFTDLLELDRITAIRSALFSIGLSLIEVCQANPLRQALYFITTNKPDPIQLAPFSIVNSTGQAAWIMQTNELKFHRDKDFKMVTDGWFAITAGGPTDLVVFESLYGG